MGLLMTTLYKRINARIVQAHASLLTETLNVRKSIRMNAFSEPVGLSSDFVYIKCFEDDILAFKGKMASEWVYDRPIVRLSEDATR